MLLQVVPDAERVRVRGGVRGRAFLQVVPDEECISRHTPAGNFSDPEEKSTPTLVRGSVSDRVTARSRCSIAASLGAMEGSGLGYGGRGWAEGSFRVKGQGKGREEYHSW